MKKFTVIFVVLLVLIIAVFLGFNMNKKNDLYITFNINEEIYDLGITPVFSLENLSDQKEQQVIVNRSMDSAVFDTLKNGDYRVSLSFDDVLYESKNLSIENSELFKLTQKHSIAFLVLVPRKISSLAFNVNQDVPGLTWETEGSIIPDNLVLSFGDRYIDLSSEKEAYSLLPEDLDYIYSNDIKTIDLEIVKSDKVLDKKSLNINSALYNVEVEMHSDSGKSMEFSRSLPFISELFKSRIFIDEKQLSTQTGNSFFQVELESLLPYLREDNTLVFKIITEYNNLKISEKIFDIPVYVNSLDIVASYDFERELNLINTNTDVLAYIDNNILTTYSFNSFDAVPLSISYKGKTVYDSEVTVEDKKIQLFDLAKIKIEAVQVNNSKVTITLKQDTERDGLITPAFVDVSGNGTKTRLEYATSITLERVDKADLNLSITPVYFEELAATPLQVIAKRYELLVHIPELLLSDHISVSIDSEPYDMNENSVVFYDFDASENVLLSFDYEDKNLYEMSFNLKSEKNKKIDIPEFERVEISDIVFTDKNVDLLLTGISPATMVTFKPEYFYLQHDGTTTRFNTPVISLENTDESGDYSIIPVYKNDIQGKAILYWKPEKFKVDTDYEKKTLNNESEIQFSVYPVNSNFEYTVQYLVDGEYIDINIEKEDNKLVLPLTVIGDNTFRLLMKDEYNQTISENIEISRLNSPDIKLEEFNFVNGKLYARWTEDPFYDSYTVNYSYDGQDSATKETTGNTLEINDIKEILTVSVVGNHDGLTRVCFDTEIDVSEYVENSVISNYSTEKIDDTKLKLSLNFRNQNSINNLNMKLINEEAELIDEKTFNKSELEKFGDEPVESIWDVVSGETYQMLFNYEYVYNREGKQLHFSNEEKSELFYVERPEKLEIKALYQNDRNGFFVQTNDFGTNVVYIFDISDGTTQISMESNTNKSDLLFGEPFEGYFGELTIDIRVFDLLTRELLDYKKQKIEKIDADVFLRGTVDKNRAYLSKTVFITGPVLITTDVFQKFYNCDMLFDEGAYIDLFYSSLEIIDSTVTTSDYQKSTTVNNGDYLIKLETSSLKMTGSDVRNTEKFLLANFNSHVFMENCTFLNIDYPIQSTESDLEFNYVGAYNSVRFFNGIFNGRISISNSEFVQMDSCFKVANCNRLELNNVVFNDIRTEAVNVYDSATVEMNQIKADNNRMVLDANNINLSVSDLSVSNSQYGLFVQNSDVKMDHLSIQNSKEGIYLYNCFSQLINSSINTEQNGLVYSNELLKSSQDIFKEINFADEESIRENQVVSLINNTLIKSDTAIHITSGTYNIVYKGLSPSGNLIHGGITSGGGTHNRTIGRIIYLKQGENLDMNYEFAPGEENVFAPTIPVSQIVNIRITEESTEVTDDEAPEEIINKYKD